MRRNIDILSVCQTGMLPVYVPDNGEHFRSAHRPQAYVP
jgi:hypothetical protein